jgi:hypothetical protein
VGNVDCPKFFLKGNAMRLAVLLFALWTPAAWSMTPVKCSQIADVIHALISGRQLQVPAEMHPYIQAAAKYFSESGDKDPYTHSTVFFMECIRTGANLERMYEKRHLVDPTKKFVGA